MLLTRNNAKTRERSTDTREVFNDVITPTYVQGRSSIPSEAYVHVGDVQQHDRACPVAPRSSRCMRTCPVGFTLDRRPAQR